MRKPINAEDLYRRAQTHDLSEGYLLLRNILKHQNCDRGTALMMYWRARPEYFTRYSKEDEIQRWERINYKFVKLIEEKYTTITNEVVIYDPHEDGKVGLYAGEFEPKYKIPEIMYQKTNGTRHFKEVEKGIW